MTTFYDKRFCKKCNTFLLPQKIFSVLHYYYSIILLNIAKEVRRLKSFSKEKVAKEFGQFIREARERKGLTHYAIAEQLGVSRSYYTMIEAGNRDIYFSLALRICDVLNLNLDDLRKRLK